ncbi:hypothetical protein COU57_02335 [Candidatus Pacearchaeota archaeon CG10_big_fil_rev_8_21_14_0_10_32_14]|nr:MAG: hypothetical protein COU57_02335 [Candidatus Pacearchaeota archaeon CG10_big_fil_rev_8_21_14_0_10_32_14]
MDSREEVDLYIGVDESNHGKYPEIIVASFSQDPFTIQERTIPKQRIHKSTFLETLECDYSFLLLKSSDRERLNYSDLMANIIGSLLYGKISQFNTSHIFVDGELKNLQGKEVDDLKRNIANIIQAPKSRITLKSGPDFDRTYPLVNIADGIAHYIFSKLTPQKIAENSHLVELLL